MEKLPKLQLLILTLLTFVSVAVIDIERIAKSNAAGIATSRDIASTLAKHNEQVMLDFMSRTVARWDNLSRNNPDLKVPKVVEPLDTPSLSDDALQRDPTPTPTR